jgi:predicted Zn-dependent protease
LKFHRFPIVLLALTTCIAGARGADVKLPDIGSSAGALMSPTEQREYGASMLHELRAYGRVLDDPLLSDYINSLGYRLVAHSDRPDIPFTFFVVRDEDINAFAAPGGYVGINAGMMVAAPDEAELAGVIAHEIAHITQEHLLRAYEDMKKASLPIALAMIGALIASSGRGDDAAPAAIVSGTSLMQQRMINFTRKDESEADRVGIQTLAESGFDPGAMARSFEILQKVMRTNGVDVPEFLRTHPVDTRRIADAKSRAGQLEAVASAARRKIDPQDRSLLSQSILLPLARIRSEASSAPASADPPDAVVYYAQMRERARVLSSDRPHAVLAYYTKNLRDDPEFDTPAHRYGFALALTRVGRAKEAAAELAKVAARHTGDRVIQLGLAAAQDRAGNHAEAARIYEQLNGNFPGNRAISLAYADSLLARADKDSAQRARALLRPLLGVHAEDPGLQESFARAAELSGDKVRAGEAYAEAAYLNGRAEDALNQLKALLESGELDYYQRARVDARITQLTPIVLELRRTFAPRNGRDAPESAAPVLACCGW